MRMRVPILRVFFGLSLVFCLSTVAAAQRGVKGQIFLPNGSPVQKVTRFTLFTMIGNRNEIHFTDSNGRIAITSPPVGDYTITVESDNELYDTTTVSFNSRYVGNHIAVHLRPLPPKPTGVIGKVNAKDVDRNVPPKAKEFYTAAFEFIKAGQYEPAIEPLKQAIAIEKNYFQAHNDLGVVYMKLRRYPEAEAEFKQAIKINGDAPQPHLNLGLVLNRQKKHKEAAEVLLKTQRRHPDVDGVHAPLVEALFGAQMWREAEVAVKRALNVAGLDRLDLQVKLGTVYLRQAKYADAVGVLTEVITAEPDHAMAQFEYGAALLQLGRLDEAETALKRAYAIRGAQMPGVQMMLGQLYFQKKEYDRAIESFELYLRHLPDAPNAAQVREAIARLRQSKIK